MLESFINGSIFLLALIEGVGTRPDPTALLVALVHEPLILLFIVPDERSTSPGAIFIAAHRRAINTIFTSPFRMYESSLLPCLQLCNGSFMRY